MAKRLYVNVATAINAADVRTEIEGGHEWLVVSSRTLPDNVVMNGGLYPADEIAAAFNTLNNTHAPVGHPQDSAGNYILCTDPLALTGGYLVGAMNRNATRANGIVSVEKWINVPTAMQSANGKRLIAALNALAKGGDPIHTSTGLLLEREELPAPQVNAEGKQYSWIARNMRFDHDAILLDQPGAATPDQGVGIGVNAQLAGEEVQRVVAINSAGLDMSGGMRTSVAAVERQWQAIRSQAREALRARYGDDKYVWIDDINDDTVVYEVDDQRFAIGYSIADNGALALSLDEPTPVVAVTMFQRVVNKLHDIFRIGYTKPDNTVNTKEGDPMRDQIVAALNAAGVPIEGLSDAQMLAAYNTLQAQPATDKLAALTQEVNTIKNDLAASQRAPLIASIGDKSGLSVNTLQTLPLEELQALAAKHNTTTVGINSQRPAGTPAELPAMPA